MKNNPNEFQKKKRTLNGIHLGIISYKYIYLPLTKSILKNCPRRLDSSPTFALF